MRAIFKMSAVSAMVGTFLVSGVCSAQGLYNPQGGLGSLFGSSNLIGNTATPNCSSGQCPMNQNGICGPDGCVRPQQFPSTNGDAYYQAQPYPTMPGNASPYPTNSWSGNFQVGNSWMNGRQRSGMSNDNRFRQRPMGGGYSNGNLTIPASMSGIAMLPEWEQSAALSQRTCPITGELLGSRGLPVRVTQNGRTFYVCCQECAGSQPGQFPGRYLTNVQPVNSLPFNSYPRGQWQASSNAILH